MVTKWMGFWSKYRSILTQDIVHVKRPDMQSVDTIMHVSANMTDPVAALAMLYNPTLTTKTATVILPLYYTGEEDTVVVVQEESVMGAVKLKRDYSIVVNATLKPHGVTYFVIRRPAGRREGDNGH
jgi:hypothetical protein